MKAINDVTKNWPTYLIKDFFLSRVHIEDIVIHEAYLLIVTVFDDKLGILVKSMHSLGTINQFLGVKGPEPAKYFYISFCFPLHYIQNGSAYILIFLRFTKQWAFAPLKIHLSSTKRTKTTQNQLSLNNLCLFRLKIHKVKRPWGNCFTKED
jgi:hypothetical protein